MPRRDPSKGWNPKIYKIPGRNLWRIRYQGHSYHFGGPTGLEDAKRWLWEWRGNHYQPPAPKKPPPNPTVTELVAAYDAFAKSKYQKFGQPTSELGLIQTALKILVRLYGPVPVAEFRPDCLRALQAEFVRQFSTWECPQCGKVARHSRDCWTCKAPMVGASTWTRNYVNEQTKRVRRCFKWGVSRDFTPPDLMAKLSAVELLAESQTTAPESEELADVPWEVVAKTLPHVAPVVADMVRLQRATGMRPGEVVRLCPCDLDRSGEEWLYLPVWHKKQHLNVGKKKKHTRKVWIGPKAQEILRPYLDRSKDTEQPVFRNRRRRAFTVNAYQLQVYRACRKAGLSEEDCWTVQQLRKALATQAELTFSLGHSQAALGHSRSETTEKHYSRAAEALARQVARELG